MKKVLTTALALGLVAGVASTAAAAFDSFSISGYYLVEGNYATNTVRNGGVNLMNSDDYSSAWYYHKARLYPVLKVNDKVTMKAELRMLHDDWGGGNGDDKAGSDMFDWDKLWMQYASPVGMIHVGTTPWGSWGTAFGNSGSRMNAIKYFPPVPAPFTSVVFTGKVTENDSAMTAGDQDYDYTEGRLGYKADGMKGELGLGWMDNGATAMDAYRLRGYAVANLGAINVEGEFDHKFGDASATTDFDTWAFYGKVSGKAGDMSWGALAWFVTGEDTDADTTAYGHPGTDFSPLLIATGDNFGLLQNDGESGGATYYTAASAGAGQMAFGAFVSMPVSDKLTLTSVVGTAYADDTSMLEAAAGGASIDDHYGYEIDVKADYKLLDNLTYSLNFGYFAAGNLFDDAHEKIFALTSYSDDVILVNHTLNMSF